MTCHAPLPLDSLQDVSGRSTAAGEDDDIQRRYATYVAPVGGGGEGRRIGARSALPSADNVRPWKRGKPRKRRAITMMERTPLNSGSPK